MESPVYDAVLSIIGETEQPDWTKAMSDIFYFIEHFVPKSMFDLEKANPKQLQVLSDLQNGNRNFIIRAPRKGGKTILVAIIAVWLALRRKCRVCVIAGSLEQAKWLYRYCYEIVTGHAEIQKWLEGEPTQTWTKFKHKSFIICIPASTKQVNAPTVDVEIFDEYVIIPPDIVTEAWPMNRASSCPMRFILSTAQDKISLDSFLDIFDRADELGFQSYWWSDKDSPWLNKEENEVAKSILDKEDYDIHYRGGIPMKHGMVWPRLPLTKAIKKRPEDLPENYFNEIKGPIKVGVDWGFTHDTVFLAGWLSLNWEVNVFKIGVFAKTDDEELAEIAVEWDAEFYEKHGQRVDQWICDSAGAFQNSMMRKKGLWITPRIFGHRKKGKEWMIGIADWYFKEAKANIPGFGDVEILRRQLMAYRREKSGFPTKGFDHCVDSFLCLVSGWDPTEAEEAPRTRIRPTDQFPEMEKRWSRTGIDWSEMRPGEDSWKPQNWKEQKWPWE